MLKRAKSDERQEINPRNITFYIGSCKNCFYKNLAFFVDRKIYESNTQPEIFLCLVIENSTYFD